MEKCSFFNSIDGDRKYKTEEWAEYFASFIGNGVFPNPSNNLTVVANGDMTVTLKAGKAWINGYFYYNTDDLILTIGTADGVLDRIDRIVIRLDYLNREIKAYCVSSDIASSPTAHVPQRDADIYELAVADIAVNNGTVEITQDMITDLRLDTSVCGLVSQTVQSIDTSDLLAQMQSWFYSYKTDKEDEFYAWFNFLQDVLDENAETNILNLIADIQSNYSNLIKDSDVYNDVDAMLADQSNQTEGQYYQAGTDTYRKKASTTGEISDYDAVGGGGGTSPNILINSNFDENIRNYTSGATLASGKFGHDRWKAGASGGDYTYTDVENTRAITIATGKTDIQTVEGKKLSSGNYTLSWKGTAQAKVGVGSFSSSPITASVTGGTDLDIEFNEGTVYEPMFVVGDKEADYYYEDPKDNQARCGRYAKIIKGGTISGARILNGICASTVTASFPIYNILSDMRTGLPTLTFSNATDFTVVSDGAGVTTITNISFSAPYTLRASSSGMSTAKVAQLRDTGNSGWILLDDEI